MSLLIQGGTVVTAGGRFLADVLVEGEKITAVGHGFPTSGVEVVDARGKYVLPGGIDVHTHLDMPLGDIASSDNFASGQVAAAFGGTTTHLDFCNQDRGQSLREALDIWHAKARGRATIDYGFHVTLTDVTDAVLDEIATLPSLGVTTIKVLMAYKGRVQVDDESLFRAMERARDAGILTMVHCENGDVIDVLIRQARARGETDTIYHALTRPPALEGEATNRALIMAELLGAPIYIVHVTCRDALQHIRQARGRGVNVRAETCVQYLFFTMDDLRRPDFEGAKWVCSPPFRTDADREALWDALAGRDLDVVSTDHCPFHFATQKVRGRDDFSLIPNGIPGLEDRLLVLHQAGVNGGRISMERFVELTATAPARLFGLSGRKGVVAPGHDADIAIWDVDRERVMGVEGSHSNVDYNLYEGMHVCGVPEKVYLRGRLIVDGDRFLAEPGTGQYLKRDPVDMKYLLP